MFDNARYYSSYSDVVRHCLEVWNTGVDAAYSMPKGIALTLDENEKYQGCINDIITFASENILMFITGQQGIDKFESFVEELNGMGLQDCIDIQQAALERYLKR